MKYFLFITIFVTIIISVSCSSLHRSFKNMTEHLMSEATDGLKNIAALSLKSIATCVDSQTSNKLYFQITFKRSLWRHQLMIEEVKFYQAASFSQAIDKKCSESVLRNLENTINDAESFKKNGFEMYIESIKILNLFGHLKSPHQIKFIIGKTKEEVKFSDDDIFRGNGPSKN